MVAKNKFQIQWRAKPEKHTYLAAESYLNLTHSSKQAARLVAALRKAPLTRFQAKDIFRASRLSLLGLSNLRIQRDREKIEAGIDLSPLLLVRNDDHGRVEIADGYHRLCAVYSFDEDAWIPCKIV